jgi:hypothetical protein
MRAVMKTIDATSLLLVLAPLCLVAPAIRAQVTPQRPMGVHLDVTVDDALHQRVTSCLVEELKAFPDMVQNDGATALTLSVIVVEQKMSDGQMIGYLVYEGGYQPGPQCSGDDKLDPSSRPVVVYWQTLRMLPPDLKKACQRIVADFKTEVVDPTRAAQRGISGHKGE